MGSKSVPILTVEDIARTYSHEPDPVGTLNQYTMAKELRGEYPDKPRSQIAREVGRPPSAVRGWLVEGKRPLVVKAVETAEDRGWLPLYADDRVFSAFNHLVAWIFAGGSIIGETYQPTFSIDKTLHRPILSQAFSTLDLDCEMRSREEVEGRLDVGLEERPTPGPLLGRILHALGAPRGKKTGQVYTLPKYLNQISESQRRAFARVYVLLRGSQANETGDGVVMDVRREREFLEELADFIRSETGHHVQIQNKGDRIYVSNQAVETLAGGKHNSKAKLAFKIAYGEDGTLVSEEAFVNTYRGSYRNPWTVVKRYQAVRDRMAKAADPSELSATDLAEAVGGSNRRIYHWLHSDTKPYAIGGLNTALDRGWIDIDLNSEVMRNFNRLVAWTLTAGNITRSNMHPKFAMRGKAHRTLLDKTLDTLDLTYTEEQSRVPFGDFLEPNLPHAHLGNDGAVLGRVLSVLGAPLGSHTRGLLALPAYLWVADDELKKSFARILLLNRIVTEQSMQEEVTLSIPTQDRGLKTSLFQFFEGICEGQIHPNDRGVVLDSVCVDQLLEPGGTESQALTEFHPPLHRSQTSE